jgi:hypothetical protein
MPFEKDPNEIGALWEKSSAKGPYMTGTINGVRVVLFKNGNKRGEKSPDWRVMKSQPRETGNPTQGDESMSELGHMNPRHDYGDPPF